MSATDERHVFRGRIVELVVLDGRWEVVRHADAVAVLVRDAEGRVLGVTQRRHAVSVDTWELPAGLIDPGETPAAAAARELAEEAGLAGTLTPVAAAYVSPGFTDEKVHLFEARDLRPATAEPDPGEDLAVVWRAPDDAWAAMLAGTLTTSMVTLLGLRHALAQDGRSPAPSGSPSREGAPDGPTP